MSLESGILLGKNADEKVDAVSFLQFKIVPSIDPILQFLK